MAWSHLIRPERLLTLLKSRQTEVKLGGHRVVFLRQRSDRHCHRPEALIKGELEITDVNKAYLQKGSLRVEKLGRGIAWLDTGTHESLSQASVFIQTIEDRQGLKVACLEEIAYQLNYITADQVKKMAEPLKKNGYGKYLLSMLKYEKADA